MKHPDIRKRLYPLDEKEQFYHMLANEMKCKISDIYCKEIEENINKINLEDMINIQTLKISIGEFYKEIIKCEK
jgi:hypothetical protein